ncbi:MAG: ComEC family competence protein [Candidatus Zambryskibacteria bacterium]|nr:ComEC family competence protein [Candidatus Zambryskibacteria bacterium]
MRDRAIFIVIFSFAFGVLVSSLIFVSPIISVFLIVVALAILAGEKLHQNKISWEVLFIFLALIFFSFGSLRYAVKDFYESTTPSLEGVVVSEPEQRDNATRFVFLSDNREKVLVSTDIYAEVEYGDKVILNGAFKRPGIIENEDSGRNFDYAAYLAKDDIYHTMSFAEVEIVGKGEGNPIKHTLFKVKRSLVSRMKEVFAEPNASLLAGLVVSGRDAMPQNILEEFRRAGIIHIVVLSGYNVTIIADFLRKFFEKVFLATRFAAVPALASGASIAGIILFVLMTGAEATVVRASIMVLTVIVAKMLGREYSAPRALLLAGFIMLLENPKILAFDPSFQLSFLATLALIYVVPIIEKFLYWITDWWNFRGIVATTLGTQLTVLPLLVYSIGDLSLVSLPANVLVLLIIPYVMLLGFIAALLSYIGFIIALPFAYPAHILLVWILGVSNFFGNMSFASIVVPNVSIVVVLVLYALLVIFVKRWKSSLHKSSN